MLYDNDDDNNELDFISMNDKKISKKVIICGIIILCCVIIMVIAIIVSSNNSSKKSEAKAETTKSQQQEQVQSKDEKKETKKEEKKEITTKKGTGALQVYSGEHVQIAKHDVSEIKTEFMPKQNDNAREEIANLYNSEEKVAYLTFDDGPSKNITPQILDILKQENVTATFFVLGSRVELYPDLVKREHEEGHYLANHGYSHQYSKIYASRDTVFDEYVQTENAIKNALENPDFNTFLFRFPGGSSGGKYAGVKAEAKELLNSYGVNYTNWNCLTGDAEGNTNTESLLGCLQETMQGDGTLIVLMHDASDKSYTVEALPTVISYLREQGYTFKNFYEIFK